jgi:hypothetical protein
VLRKQQLAVTVDDGTSFLPMTRLPDYSFAVRLRSVVVRDAHKGLMVSMMMIMMVMLLLLMMTMDVRVGCQVTAQLVHGGVSLGQVMRTEMNDATVVTDGEAYANATPILMPILVLMLVLVPMLMLMPMPTLVYDG